MFRLLSKSLGQLTDPKTRGVILQCVAMATVLYASIVGLAWWGVSQFTIGIEWLDTILSGLGGLVALTVGFVFYPALVTVLLGLFSETICSRVEARHYPEHGPGRPQPMPEVITGTINFAGKAIALNLLALLLTFWLPGLNIFVFVAVNGYLISVEYFELVAVRRMELKAAKRLRQKYAFRLWGAGMIFALAMFVPIISIIAPVLAMVFMVHVLEILHKPSVQTDLRPIRT